MTKEKETISNPSLTKDESAEKELDGVVGGMALLSVPDPNGNGMDFIRGEKPGDTEI